MIAECTIDGNRPKVGWGVKKKRMKTFQVYYSRLKSVWGMGEKV